MQEIIITITIDDEIAEGDRYGLEDAISDLVNELFEIRPQNITSFSKNI